MTGDTKRDCSVAVRLNADEKLRIAARAACEGLAISPHIRRVLLGQTSRPLPTLAASAELLAICQALVRVADGTEPVADDIRQFVFERAEMVFEILRQHGHSGASK
ncbi:hypothetical protein [Erythrobacter sp.]|uniref:plasmid mobilization protein n=1 Tax=Erythrobacter sp. TaxID=1042 RepID=UPI0025EB1A66|nr:hypothetical protein [Erythrobacter sp.]